MTVIIIMGTCTTQQNGTIHCDNAHMQQGKYLLQTMALHHHLTQQGLYL